MVLLKPIRVSTSHFSYNADTNTMVAEISDLGPDFEFEPVYVGLPDVGLTLVSQRTGNMVTMVVVRKEKSCGCVVAWHLVPADGQQIATGLKAIIFND